MSIDNIAEGRRREIADEFDELLSEGKDTEEAADLLAHKYTITKEDVEQIVRGERDVAGGVPQEENGDDEDDDDDDPEGRKVA